MCVWDVVCRMQKNGSFKWLPFFIDLLILHNMYFFSSAGRRQTDNT